MTATTDATTPLYPELHCASCVGRTAHKCEGSRHFAGRLQTVYACQQRGCGAVRVGEPVPEAPRLDMEQVRAEAKDYEDELAEWRAERDRLNATIHDLRAEIRRMIARHDRLAASARDPFTLAADEVHVHAMEAAQVSLGVLTEVCACGAVRRATRDSDGSWARAEWVEKATTLEAQLAEAKERHAKAPASPDPWDGWTRLHKDESVCEASTPIACGRAHIAKVGRWKNWRDVEPAAPAVAPPTVDESEPPDGYSVLTFGDESGRWSVLRGYGILTFRMSRVEAVAACWAHSRGAK